MEKKTYYTLFTLALLTVFTPLVKAKGVCSSSVLYDEKVNAAEVSIDFETKEEEVVDETLEPPTWTDYYINLIINNIPDNVRIEIESIDDESNVDYVITSADRDENNNRVIRDDNIDVVKRLKFDIISTSDDCYGEALKSVTLNTPMFNGLIHTPMCAQYPDFKYCTAFTFFDVSDIDATSFNGEIEHYINGKDEEDKKEEKDSVASTVAKTFKKYWIVVAVLVVALGGLIAFIVIKKKRSSVI